jgi:hypothetical protein
VKGLLRQSGLRLGNNCHRRSREFWGHSKSRYWPRFFSSGWGGSIDVLRPMVTTSGNQNIHFHRDRI